MKRQRRGSRRCMRSGNPSMIDCDLDEMMMRLMMEIIKDADGLTMLMVMIMIRLMTKSSHAQFLYVQISSGVHPFDKLTVFHSPVC